MADAPKINPTDTLRESYPKLNQSIDNANEALRNSEKALNTANQALANSENTQEQLDQIVIEGDSSVEAAQARVDADGNVFTTLKERLDTKEQSFSAQLAQTATKTELTNAVSPKADKSYVDVGLTKKANQGIGFTADNCIEIPFELSPNYTTVYNMPLKMFIYPDGRVRVTGRVRLVSKEQQNNVIAILKAPVLINGLQYQITPFEIVRNLSTNQEKMIIRFNAVNYWNPESPSLYRYASLALGRTSVSGPPEYHLHVHGEDFARMLVGAELYVENEAYWQYFDQSELYRQIYQKANSLNDSNFNFIYAPDIHASLVDTRHDIGINYINKVRSYCDMPIISPGDLTQDYDIKIKVNSIKKIVNSLGANFFFTKGNHDDNSLYSKNVDQVIDESGLRELIFKKMRPTGFEITFSDTGLYYYADDPKRKIRLVFLNTHENDYTVVNGQIKEDAGAKGYINQKQLEFVAYDALNFEQKGADYTNWHVIFFAHYPLHFAGTKAYGGETTENGEQMWEIIKAFKNGTSITIPPVTRSNPAHDLSGLTVDFTQQGPMSVVGFFYGHYHNDQLQVKDGITLVSSECFSAADYNVNWEQVARHVFSYDEFAFDIVTIDKSSRKVTLKRIGNDSLGDREFTY